MKESFLYIQCNLVCYIAIEKYGLADEKNTSLPMTLQNCFDQRSFPDRMCLRNPAVGGFGPVREETCLETRVERSRTEQSTAGQGWSGEAGWRRAQGQILPL